MPVYLGSQSLVIDRRSLELNDKPLSLKLTYQEIILQRIMIAPSVEV